MIRNTTSIESNLESLDSIVTLGPISSEVTSTHAAKSSESSVCVNDSVALRDRAADLVARARWLSDQRDLFDRKHDSTDADSASNISEFENGNNDEGNPKKFAHFELLESLGSGAFGTVWKASDTLLDRIVAIKIPHPHLVQGGEESQLLHEARTAAKLSHPNIVRVHEIGRHDGTCYIVSDFIRGQTLTQRIRNKKFNLHQSVALCKTLAEALDHAHCNGTIHRDLKPDNVMIDEQDNPHIMDFGLAKHENGRLTVTMQGDIIGTPTFMSPEQAKGESHRSDARTDIYSLGVILFQAITGEVPFRGELEAILLQVINADPPRPRALSPNIPKDLETICLKCLEKDPNRRYATAKELADDFQRFLNNEPVKAKPIGPVTRSARWCQRNMLATFLTATVCLTLLIGSATSLHFASESQKSLVVAKKEERAAIESKRALEQKIEELALEKTLYEHSQNLKEQGLYDGQMSDIAKIWKQDPRMALSMLLDPNRCPAACRNLAWHLYYSLCTSEVTNRIATTLKVKRANISQDGKIYAILDDNKKISLFRQSESTPFQTITNSKSVESLCLTKTGHRLAIGFRSGEVQIRNTIDAKIIRTIRQLNGQLEQITFSPDEKRIAVASKGLIHGAGNTGLWDIQSGKLISSLIKYLEPHDPCTVAFSPNGKLIATGGYRSNVFLWDQDGKFIESIPDVSSQIRQLTFSADSQQLAIGFAKHKVAIYNLKTKQFTKRTSVGNSYIEGIAFSQCGQTVVTWSRYDDYLRILDLKTDHIRPAVWNKSGIVVHARLDSAGRSLTTIDINGNLSTHRLAKDLDSFRLDTNATNNWASTISNDGKLLVTGDQEGKICCWSLTEQRCTQVLRGHTGSVLGISLHPFRNILASAGADGTVRLWKLGEQDCVILPGHVNKVGAGLSFSPDGKYLASAGYDHRLIVWDVETQQKVHQVDHQHAILAIKYSSCGNYLAYCHDKEIILRSVDGKAIIQSLPSQSVFTDIAWSPDSQTLAATTTSGKVLAWIAADGRVQFAKSHTERPLRALTYSHDGKSIVLGGDDHTMILINSQTGYEHARFVMDAEVTSLSCSPTTNQIVLTDKSATVKVWNPNPRISRPTTFCEPIALPITDIVLHPNKNVVATSSDDGMVRKWNIVTGREVWRSRKVDDKTFGVRFNGDQLTFGATNGTVYQSQSSSRAIQFSKIHKHPICRVEQIDDGTTLTADWHGDVAIHFPDQHSRLLPIHQIYSIALSNDGSHLAAGNRSGDIYIFELHDLTVPVRFIESNHGRVTALCLSEDGTRVFAGYENKSGMIAAWDIHNGQRIASYQTGSNNHIQQICELSDAQSIVVRADHVVRKIDTRNGSCESLLYEGAHISAMAVSPNADQCVLALINGQIVNWQLAAE